MFRNHFTIAIRQLRKSRVYSLINITGLSFGMSIALIIGLWIYDELSFNNSIPDHTRIAEIMRDDDNNGNRTAFSGGPYEIQHELLTKYKSDFKYIVLCTYTGSHILTVNEKSISIKGEYMGEDVSKLLSLKIHIGDPAGLHDPSSVFLAASTARSLFGDASALGQIVRLDSGQLLRVAAVYEDLPASTSFKDLGFIASVERYASMQIPKAEDGNPWQMFNLYSIYVQLADGADMEKVSEKICYLRRDNMPASIFNADKQYEFLYPMARWHLFEPVETAASRNKIQYVWLMGCIGAFVLLLACINFINLSTARSEKRAKEVGIRKTIGSARRQIIIQFYFESALSVTCALVICLIWTQMLLPVFNDIADKQLRILWSNPAFWGIITGTTVLTSVIAGCYPAVYLSSFRPIETLKSSFRVGVRAATSRKALVVFQFTISISLIIGTIVIDQQIRYAQQRPIGYSKAGLLTIARTPGIENHFSAFRADLKAEGIATDAALVTSTPTEILGDDFRFDWKGKNPDFMPLISISTTTPGYGKIIGWQLKEGRDFDPSKATDSSAFILNEAAVRLMGFQHPLEETVMWHGKMYRVIGVIRDILDQSPYQPANPEIFHVSGNQHNWAVVLRVNPSVAMAEALTRIKRIYTKYERLYPMEYHFVDQEYAKKFSDEQRIGRLALLFTLFAIGITCLGLFGMAAFMAEKRRREIGIRKALGASTFRLWRLLTKEFVLLVVIALFIAGPIAWVGMNKWLEEYSYRTTITWWVFAAAGGGALLITFATVSYQSVKASLTNPTKSLRSE